MIKLSTLFTDSSNTTLQKKSLDITPGPVAVKLLISYSKALQVLHCNDFETCYVILN
ncbi:MAG: hypothetical protein WCR72_12370 [Bacteroidota bacterium]